MGVVDAKHGREPQGNRSAYGVGKLSLRAALCVTALGACYNYVPVEAGAPSRLAGSMVALDITDRGRAGLAERFGSGVTRIEGRLRAVPGTTYDLQVFKVEYIRDAAKWSGEPVSIDRDFVGGVNGREFARGKTAAAVGAAGGAILAFVITRQLVSSGQEPGDSTPGPDPGMIRWAHRQHGFPSFLRGFFSPSFRAH